MKLQLNAAEFDFSNHDFTNAHDPSPAEIGELSADVLRHRYAELFALLDMDKVACGLYSWVRINVDVSKPLSIPEQLAQSELAILTLLERGVIRPAIPLESAPEALAQFENLQQAVRKSGLRPDPAPAATAVEEIVDTQPTEADQDAAAIQFYRVNPTSEVKARMRSEPDFNARILRLMAENRI